MDISSVEYETKRLDHLGIIAGICHEIGLVETINELLKKYKEKDSGRKVSCGTAVLAMIMNGLGLTSRALYLMPEYMENKPIKLLTGEDLEASDFNDDSLGRALDELYALGITEVFAEIVKNAIKAYKLDIEFAHTDTSSLSLTGRYEGASEEDAGLVKITHGYSKDHRPDLKQVVVTLVTSQQGRIPLWLEVLDGNSSDKTSLRETVNAYCDHLTEGKEPWFVMDSAAYTATNIGDWGTEKKWLTRVPESIKEAQAALQSIKTEDMNLLSGGYAIHAMNSSYADIEQRWLVVYSEQAEKRELKRLDKQVTRATNDLEKALKQLHKQEFACEKDAANAVTRLNKKLKWHSLKPTYQPIEKYSKKGRPSKGAKPEIVTWQVQATYQLDTQQVEEKQQTLGRFLLATNELDTQSLSDENMLNCYKEQGTTVERGFRFFKDPLFFAHSLFLESPARIMAMTMIMGLCLLIYSLAEYQLRQSLKENDQTIPDQKGQPTQSPTMRRVAQLFEGVDLLIIRHGEYIVQRQILKLSQTRLNVIQLFSPTIRNYYVFDS